MNKQTSVILSLIVVLIAMVAVFAVAGLGHENNGNDNGTDSDLISVVYDGNGGTCDIVDSNKYEHGSQYHLIYSPTPVRAGYVFLGWDKDSNSTSALFREGDSYATTLSPLYTNVVTFYAIWSTYDVSYDYSFTYGTSFTDSASYSSPQTYSANAGSQFAFVKMTFKNLSYTDGGGFAAYNFLSYMSVLGSDNNTYDLSGSSSHYNAEMGGANLYTHVGVGNSATVYLYCQLPVGVSAVSLNSNTATIIFHQDDGLI